MSGGLFLDLVYNVYLLVKTSYTLIYQLSRSTGFVTYSLALASASRDDVSTCGSPRGQLMSRQRAVRTVHSFIV